MKKGYMDLSANCHRAFRFVVQVWWSRLTYSVP